MEDQAMFDLLTGGVALIIFGIGLLWSICWVLVPFKVYAMAKDLRSIKDSLPLR